MRHRLLALSLALATGLSAAASASTKTMPFSQVRKGMRGYGETVFDGTKLERFDVEITGLLENIGPGQDLILAKISGPEIERSGVIAGMSGSPIYIDGKVIGALAYSWQFSKEAIAGITPIDEMLKIAEVDGLPGGALIAATPRMTGGEFLQAIIEHKTAEKFDLMMSGLAGATPASAVAGARPIATPLSMSSFSPDTLGRFSKYLDPMGFMPVPSGASSNSATTNVPAAKEFKAGDAIGAVLLRGDFNVAATGTVTYIDGDRVYAFGHPFLDMGEVAFPMAQSEIVGVLPSLASSFKFANTGAVVGAFRQDRAVGIMGVMGEKADMIPVDMDVEGSGPAQKYHVDVLRHSQLTPLILAMAADTVVANAQRAAGERTVMLESEIKVRGFREPITLREGWAGAQARQAIPTYLAVVAGYVMSNEFRTADIESVKIHLRHTDDLKIAKILEASVEMPDKGRIHPGDTVKVRAVLKPYRGAAFVDTFDVTIPEDQPAGAAYMLIGSGSVLNQVDFMLVPPDPRSLDQVIAVLRRLRPSTELTLGLYEQTDGAVTAGVYLPNLPPTMRAIVSSDTSNGPQAPVRYHASEHLAHPLDYIIDGVVKIDLDVKPAS
ncbi:MAG TPA: SpoIVB peptidase S55 domain-containing protein [Thermoanaerobaculia bacterium]|nr:SpoIVB peptidase S55 domain-containing protein [Thermoanaerobaculia bacterium]